MLFMFVSYPMIGGGENDHYACLGQEEDNIKNQYFSIIACLLLILGNIHIHNCI